LQDFQGFVDMSLEVQLGVKDMTDNSLFVDDIGHTTGENKQGRRNAIEFTNLVPLITEEGEGEVVFLGELFMGGDGIAANPDDFGSRIAKGGVAISEGAGFGGTAGSIVFGVEIQHDGFVTFKVAEAYGLAVLVFEGEVGGAIADVNRCHSLLSKS